MYAVGVDSDDEVKYLQEEAALAYFDKNLRNEADLFGVLGNANAWWNQKKVRYRTWVAEFVSTDGNRHIPLGKKAHADLWGEVDSPFWGYPNAEAVQVLERLAEEGWDLVAVSEDKGQYAGTDAVNESYTVRVRYLLRRPTSEQSEAVADRNQ